MAAGTERRAANVTVKQVDREALVKGVENVDWRANLKHVEPVRIAHPPSPCARPRVRSVHAALWTAIPSHFECCVWLAGMRGVVMGRAREGRD